MLWADLPLYSLPGSDLIPVKDTAKPTPSSAPRDDQRTLPTTAGT